MTLGDLKVGAELVVMVKNAPIPSITTLVGFTSKVQLVLADEEAKTLLVRFENGVTVQTNEDDLKKGLLSYQLA